MNWQAIHADPRFLALHRQKSRFLWSLMLFSIAFYLLLPLGAAWYPALFARRVWGPVNVGILFALSEFLMAWGVAFFYARVASRRFDRMAEELLREADRIGAAS
ncbi:MAG: DUF485 domain-containing protein [Gammaproteobacteria bacterium]